MELVESAGLRRKIKDQKNYKEQNIHPFKANYCHRRKAYGNQFTDAKGKH